jgi:phage replication O-like protein O
MKKGFESPNYTQVPNDLFELEMAKMGYAELKVVLAIMRQTVGYHRKKVRYSMSKLAKMTGLTTQGVRDGAEKAIENGYIIRTKDGGVTQWELNIDEPNPQVTLPPDDEKGKEALPPSIKEKRFKEKSSAPQISSFSYFGDSKIIEVVDAFNHYFKIDPPFKGGSGYTKWIKDAKTFLSICGDGNIKYIMADVYKVWKGEDFTVYDIGSIVKLARVVIARRKDVEKLIDANGNIVEMI